MNEFNNFEMDALSTVSMDDLNAALAAGNIEEQAAMPAPVELTCNWEDVRKFVSAIIPEGNLFEIRTIPKAGDTSWRVCVKNTSEGLDTAINGLVHKELYKSTLYMTLQSIQQDAQCLHRNGEIVTFKKPKPAHKVHLYFPKETTALIGHNRLTTQGNEKFNYNNHPFEGITNSHTFALAHKLVSRIEIYCAYT